MSEELFRAYVDSCIDRPDFGRMKVSNERCMELLWFFNDVFRPKLERIKTLEYDPKHEEEADAAVFLYAKDLNTDRWEELTPAGWRVLLERHIQLLMTCISKIGEDISGLVLPDCLSQDQIRAAIALLGLYQPTLQFPIEDRSTFELPKGSAPGTMTFQ